MKYDKNWYDNLAKPNFQPPEWVFAPVWVVLFILMFWAFLLVLFAPVSFANILASLLFFVQLYVNFMWTPAFFGEHNLRKAFLISALLFFLVFFTMVLFFVVSKLAGLLLLPYFLWCGFACVLCFEILERNEW